MTISTTRQHRTATAKIIPLRANTSDVFPQLTVTPSAQPQSANRRWFADLNAELAELDSLHNYLLGRDDVVTDAADRFAIQLAEFDQAA